MLNLPLMIFLVALGIIGIGVSWYRGRTHSQRLGGSIVSVGATAAMLVIAQSC